MDVYEIEDRDAKILVTHIEQCLNAVLSITESEFPDIDDSRVTYCKRITEILDAGLPTVEGDKVVQIGTTVQRFGESGCFLNHIITLRGCAPIEGAIVESYDTEEEVLLAWTRFIADLDPDFITGYNINGFDFVHVGKGRRDLGITDEFSLLVGRDINPKTQMESVKRSGLVNLLSLLSRSFHRQLSEIMFLNTFQWKVELWLTS